MKKHYFKLLMSAFGLLVGINQVSAQCSFTGLNANYCTNSAASTLTPGIAGGTFSGPGVTGSTFNPAVAGPGTFTINYNLCSTTYSITAPTFSPLSTVGTTLATTAFTNLANGSASSDDGTSVALPIGFNFQFYCNTYSNFYICTNGFIAFTAGVASPWVSTSFPNSNATTAPLNVIAFDWNDLNYGLGGAITYTTIGTAPNRKLLVSFVAVQHYNAGSGGYPITTQVILYETTNVIEIHSTTIPLPASLNNAVMGLQDATGTNFSVVSGRNSTNWSATNECYRFTPGTSCATSQTTTVSPSTISIVGSSAICNGSTGTLTASGNTTYTWSPGGSNSSSIAVSPTVNTTYSVSGTNSFGCVANSAITVTVNVTPTVTAVSSNTNNGVCPGSTVILTGSGATTYSWSASTVTNGVAFAPPTSSTYTVTGTNACGSATAAISVSVHPLPPVTASINNPTVCTGGSVTLNGGGASTYTWSGGYPNNVAFSPASSAGYTVTGTSALGCTATAVTGVTVFVTPNTPLAVTPTAICVGATATLTAAGATGYTWTPGSALNTASIVVSPPSSTTFTLVRVNGACSNTSTINLVVNPNPVMSAGATPGTICAGYSVSLTAFGAITYNWLPGGFTAANLVLYPNFSTNYVVTGSNGNCTTTMTVPVVVNPSPTISVVSTPSVCSGNAAQLSANGNAATYTWSAGPPNTAAITVTPATTTIYTITGTNSFSCTASQNALVVVYQTPSSTLSTSSPYICSAQTATIGAANTSGVSYLWNNGATTASIVVNPSVTTSYTLTATDLSSNCQGTNSITLAVYISTFSVASPTAVCKGSTATFTASGAATSYSWSSNAGGVTTATAAVTPSVSQMYSVAGITGSCQSVQTISLTVNPIPNVTATKAKSTVCVYDPNTTITAAGATSYSWSTGDLTATAVISPTISTTYTVTGTDLNGCSKTVTVTQFVAACLGIENYSGQSVQMNIYPNPNNGNFTISTDVAMSVNIVNTLGEVVKTVDLSTTSSNEVSMSNLANGIYFITGQNNGLKVNKKIVVQR